MTTLLDLGLAAEVAGCGHFDATACMNCGVCTASCPLGQNVLPRKLFHDVVLGNRAAVLAATEDIYSCLLCRMCEASCPAGVHITTNVRTLRRFVNREVFGL